MSSENRFGIDGKAWYGAAGATATTAMDEAAKVSLKLSGEEGEFGSRASHFKLTDVSVLDAELEITIKNAKRNAAPINFFFNNWKNRAASAIKVLDAATESRGIDADWICASCNNDQDNPSPQEWVFSFKPTYVTGGRYPQAITG